MLTGFISMREKSSALNTCKSRRTPFMACPRGRDASALTAGSRAHCGGQPTEAAPTCSCRHTPGPPGTAAAGASGSGTKRSMAGIVTG